VALVFVLSSCAGTQHVKVSAADLLGDIETELRAADDSLVQGDRDSAHQHLEKARQLLSAPEVQHEPDRHVLFAKLREIDDRSRGTVRPRAVSSPLLAATLTPPPRASEVSASTEPAPARASSLSAGTSAPSPAPSTTTNGTALTTVNSAPRSASSLDTSDLLSGTVQPGTSRVGASQRADPEAAFKSGPIRDEERALTLLAKGKRIRSKDQRTKVYSEAAAALTSCAEEGAELIKHHPELKKRRFAAGGQRMLGPQIPQFCEKKLRWLKKTGAVRADKLAAR
jgi:hypothetical protein